MIHVNPATGASSEGVVLESSPGVSIAGGAPKTITAAASTNATSVKASAATFAGYDLVNTAAYAVYLKLYDKASAPTVGTDVPVYVIAVLAGQTKSFALPYGATFANGLAYAITKLPADTDTTVVVAGDLKGVLFYA